jgi:hypothetical protein
LQNDKFWRNILPLKISTSWRKKLASDHRRLERRRSHASRIQHSTSNSLNSLPSSSCLSQVQG